MTSDSAREANVRPFYASRADAYDLLITEPVEPWVDMIAGVRAAGTLLDAGCGSGRHAEALLRAGFEVEIADASAALLSRARVRCPRVAAHLADICALDLGKTFDVVTCRGVLNDLVSDEDRTAAISRLAEHVSPGGALVLDVREREATRIGAGEQHSRVAMLPGGGSVRFTSLTRWRDPLLEVDETHEVFPPAGAQSVVEKHVFAMRPWTELDLREQLKLAGLVKVVIGPATYRTTPDRLLAIAEAA